MSHLQSPAHPQDALENAVAQLCATTCWFTLLRTRSVLTRWCEAAMTRLDPATPVFARLAASAAVGASKRGDLTEARAIAENVARQHHDHARFGTEVLGQISLYEGRLEDAIALGARAAAAHRDQGDEAFAVNADTIGVAALAYLGRSEAAAAATSLIAAATAIEVPSLIAMAHYFAGEATSDTGEASSHYRAQHRAGRGRRSGLSPPVWLPHRSAPTRSDQAPADPPPPVFLPYSTTGIEAV